MNIQSTKLPVPKPGFEKQKEVSITRTFDVPVTDNTMLGRMPSDEYESNWGGWGSTWTRTRTFDCYNGQCNAGPQTVYRDVPRYNADGSPMMKSVTETLTEKSYSQKNRSLIMAGVGAGLGMVGTMIGGAIAGGSALQPLALGLSAAVGAAGGFAFGYKSAAGDEVKEVWESKDISHPTMTGYTETIRPDTYQEVRDCRRDKDGNEHCEYDTKVRGYWHEYSPDISWRKVGSYTRPTLQHTNTFGPVGAGLLTGAVAGAAGVGIRLLVGA